MAASFNKRDGFTYIAHKDTVDKLASTYLEMLFDAYAEEDSREIEQRITAEKTSSRYFIIKTILFPLELALLLLLLGFTPSKIRYASQKLYWGYITKKLTFDQVKQELNNLGSV